MPSPPTVTHQANAVLYGFCHRCSHPRALREVTHVERRTGRFTYELVCPACGDTQPLSAQPQGTPAVTDNAQASR